MGTRSLTVLMQDEEREIAVMYRQFDGYPSGHGAELAEFLREFRMVNGLGGPEEGRLANGGDCLAAQIVAHFKEEPGNIYLMAAGTRDTGEEYIYTVTPKADGIHLKVQTGSMTFFGLPGTKQDNMPVIFDDLVGEWNLPVVEQADERAHEEGIVNDFVEEQTKED